VNSDPQGRDPLHASGRAPSPLADRQQEMADGMAGRGGREATGRSTVGDRQAAMAARGRPGVGAGGLRSRISRRGSGSLRAGQLENPPAPARIKPQLIQAADHVRELRIVESEFKGDVSAGCCGPSTGGRQGSPFAPPSVGSAPGLSWASKAARHPLTGWRALGEHRPGIRGPRDAPVFPSMPVWTGEGEPSQPVRMPRSRPACAGPSSPAGIERSRQLVCSKRLNSASCARHPEAGP